jgi:hypothetical protein
MNNTIKISACDNEIFLTAIFADQTDSYLLANVKSGYNYPVDVTINVESGVYKPITASNGQNGALEELRTVYLPEGNYEIFISCINWGVVWGYKYNLNGGSDYSDKGPSGIGAMAYGPKMTVTNV